MKPLGILGGTFDPVHHGHLRLAIEMAEALDLAEVRLVPLYLPPHREPPAAPAALRLCMLNAAVADTPPLTVDDRELRRARVSYTVETLAELRGDLPGRPLCLILGMDAFAGLEDWRRWREIIGLAHLAVAKRPGSALSPSGPIQGLLLDRHGVPDPSELHRREAGCLLIRDVPALDISASAIRARIAAGRSPRHLLPDAVLEIIESNSLYRETAK
ncbi:MAG: nicotinate-nucleotide adenylyltransferase [Gammaproteobacteria bacterium]